MKVILLERVERLGALGDVVTVKDGFARNFLLPRSKALRATAANLKVFEGQRVEIEARNAKARDGGREGRREAGRHVLRDDPPGRRKRPALRLGLRPRRRRRGQRRGRQGRPLDGGAGQADQDAGRPPGEGAPARRGDGDGQHQHRPQRRTKPNARPAARTSSPRSSRKIAPRTPRPRPTCSKAAPAAMRLRPRRRIAASAAPSPKPGKGHPRHGSIRRDRALFPMPFVAAELSTGSQDCCGAAYCPIDI